MAPTILERSHKKTMSEYDEMPARKLLDLLVKDDHSVPELGERLGIRLLFKGIASLPESIDQRPSFRSSRGRSTLEIEKYVLLYSPRFSPHIWIQLAQRY